MDPCILCTSDGGRILHREDLLRVVLADEPGFPGFCRVILARHEREMTDLGPAERRRVMDVVFAVEEALRATLAPHKVNVASLGNQVPHVHWHVVPRTPDDPCFPAPPWTPPQRPGRTGGLDEAKTRALRDAIVERARR